MDLESHPPFAPQQRLREERGTQFLVRFGEPNLRGKVGHPSLDWIFHAGWCYLQRNNTSERDCVRQPNRRDEQRSAKYDWHDKWSDDDDRLAGGYVDSKSLGGWLRGGPDTGKMDINQVANYSKHEFTHLLGTGDKPGAVLSNTQPSMRPSGATSQDLIWGIREAIDSVNLTREMMTWGCREWQCASVKLPVNPPIRTTNSVGAPLIWWK